MSLHENMENLRVSDDQDDISDPVCNLKEQKDVSQEVLLDFLRKCSSKIDSSESFGNLSRLIDKVTDAKINLNDFSEIYPSESDYELKVLQLFASRKATQISFLEINGVVNLIEINPPLIESQMWTEITKFKNVCNISINKYQFLLKDLMKMCKNMPSLNEIQVVIDSDSEFPDDEPQFIQEFSKSFDKIKEFMFAPSGVSLNSTTAMTFAGQLSNFGIKHLPNLKWFAALVLPPDMPPAYQEKDMTSQLQYFCLNAIYLEEFASKFEMFPLVFILLVNWNELNDTSEGSKITKKKLKLLKKFTKLNEFILSNLTSPEYLKMFLNVLGQKLNFLNLNYDTDYKMTINLKQIQETCPLLSSLIIDLADVGEIESMASFTSLKQLQIIHNVYSSEKVRISYLLSPPNLEKVHLSGFQVTRLELKEMTSKIKEKAILTKVNELKLNLKGETSEMMKNALEKEGKLFVSALLNMRQIDKEAIKLEFL